MPIADVLADFAANVQQCDDLVANAYGVDVATGANFLPACDREKITVSAFLNMLYHGETLLEEVISLLLSGLPNINRRLPIKSTLPANADAAKTILIGARRFVDYANHQNVRKVVTLYLDGGDPFQPHLDSIYSELDDLRTMRNASAHISSTTQRALDSLAARLFASPTNNITLYQLLIANDLRTPLGQTVLQSLCDCGPRCKRKLLDRVWHLA